MGKVYLIISNIFYYNLQGKYIWPDGRTYDGMWFKNKMHGNGQFTWPNGCKYEGDYYNDKRDGYGVYDWLDYIIYFYKQKNE